MLYHLYSRRKINKKDDLYEALNKYKNIKLTVEKSFSKFLDTRLLMNIGMKLKYTGNKQIYQRIGVLASLKGIREMQFQ